MQLHVEWASPKPPAGKGQDRGNSGIFLMGLYELQVLDSYGADTYADGFAGAIYGQYPPLANASRPPGQWQTYDIAFRRPRFDKDGKLVEPARMTVIHNGILIQNNEELWGRTDWLEHLPTRPIPIAGRFSFRTTAIRSVSAISGSASSPERPRPHARGSRPTEHHFASRRGPRLVNRAICDGAKEQCAAGHDQPRRGTLDPQAPVRAATLVMQAISPTEFVLPHTDARFTFQRDDQGRVTGVLFKVADGEQLLTKNAK